MSDIDKVGSTSEPQNLTQEMLEAALEDLEEAFPNKAFFLAAFSPHETPNCNLAMNCAPRSIVESLRDIADQIERVGQ